MGEGSAVLVLEEYEYKDQVPRVEMQVNRMVKYKDTICFEGRSERVESWFSSPL